MSVRRSSAIAELFLTLALFATTAAGQGARRAQVIEVLLRDCAEKPAEIEVTLDDDREPATLQRDGNLWRGNRGFNFNALGRVASANVQGRRTDCAASALLASGGDPAYIASFTLRCRQGPRLRVTPLTDNKIALPVSWVRVIHPPAGRKACEGRTASGAVIPDVDAKSDDLYLHFAPVTELVYTQYHLRIARGPLPSKPVVVKRDTVVTEFCLQRSNCSADAQEIFNRYHLDRRFSSVELRSEP